MIAPVAPRSVPAVPLPVPPAPSAVRNPISCPLAVAREASIDETFAPASFDGSSATITVTATNGVAPDATQSFTLDINEPPAITNGPPPSPGLVGTAYTFTYTFTGFPTPTFSVTSGSLPTGLTLSSAGILSGTPTVSGAR